MNFAQFYEILILRDVFFYFLPGSITMLGVSLISWLQLEDSQRLFIKSTLPSSPIITILGFLLISYILGQILYMIQSRTIGKLERLKREKLLFKHINSKIEFKDSPNSVAGFKKIIIETIFPGLVKQDADLDKLLESKTNLIQIYFTLDKYIFIKSKDVYSTYISRLSAISKFNGVMSIGWIFLALTCSSFYFTDIINSIVTSIIIIILLIFSFLFYRQNATDQAELVWNIIQATFLLREKVENKND